MNNEEVYAITDMQGYVTEMRDAAAKSVAENYEENLDEYISIKQMINLVKSECVGYDDLDRPLLNEDSNQKVYESAVVWIHNVGLAKLAAQGLIECAWDNESNEMVFWANTETKTPSKKVKTNGKSNKRRNTKKDKGS